MSSLDPSATDKSPNLIISLSDYHEFQQLRELIAAMGIKDISSITKIELLRLRCAVENLNGTKLSSVTKIDRGHLIKIENGEVDIKDKTINKLRDAFGEKFTALFRKLK